jgi:hypothetical protein
VALKAGCELCVISLAGQRRLPLSGHLPGRALPEIRHLRQAGLKLSIEFLQK